MKTRVSLFLFLCAVFLLPSLTFISCNSVKQAASFDVVYNFPKVYFNYSKKDFKASQVTLCTGKLTINFDSILGANHIPSGIISSAYLSKLAMIITAPPGATFNWLATVTVFGSADSTFQQSTQLGSATGIDPLATNINLALNNVDLKPIIYKYSYFVEILATPSGQAPSSSSINMYLDSQARIHIEPL